jgi:MFS family permease
VLIFGRSIQGVGTGGLNMILDVILSDLVPLRERGIYIAITLVVVTIGTSLGPFVGGAIVDNTTWRWVFYINLPVGGISFILLFIFLQVECEKEVSLRKKLKRIDFIGNAILMASTAALLYALTYGGSRYLWLSARIILPLVFGFGGLAAFIVFEHSGSVQEPVIPLRLFKNRTATIVFINTFIGAALLYWAIFSLPIYFQAVLVSSPTRAGVQILPVVLITVLGAVVAVIILAKFGRYKVLHGAGFAIGTIGLGLFSTLDQDSETSQWVSYQVLTAIGTGMLVNTLLPAFQAAQPESDQATATASWAFIRSLGFIWGVTIPAAILNNRLEETSVRISDLRVRGELTSGQAYGCATQDYISQFQDPIRLQIIESFADALKHVWWISVVFSGLAFLLVLVEKDIPLRTELHTEFGLEQTGTAQRGKTVG